jgi:C-terminal processing protease CtpA/Prc
MVEADLLRNRINLQSKTFDRALLEDTPKIIQELKEAKRSGEIIDVRNLYHGIIDQNKNLNLDLDEKAELKLKIDNIFKDAGVSINVEEERLNCY